jgi:tetratricopeptide (TPR) repeat protein
MMARRLDAADSLARSWRNSSDPDLREGATDIHVLVLRERGQFRESIRATQAYLASNPYDDALAYEEFDAFGHLGDYAAASHAFTVLVGQSQEARDASHALLGDRARWFTWTRALEGNAIAGSGDTVRLLAIADSMRVIAARSYYGRDPRLYHHLLGLIAMQGHRYADAEREFQAARWGPAGWTETVAWLARAQLAQGHTADAIETLREAYEGALDSMGRYEPRSELDYLMALAFTRAGSRDSAAVYGGYVRRAWRDADPEVRRLLAAL